MAFGMRGGKSTGRFLEWKIRLFFVGAVLLMVGIAREIDLLVIFAVAVLAVAFVLRFFERPDPVDEDPDEADEDEVEAETR
jgi:hypothetical protein